MLESCWSPSTRREWIEMTCGATDTTLRATSPSTRREWIEMRFLQYRRVASESPSTRREWIEMQILDGAITLLMGLPPHGGSGLKYFFSSFSSSSILRLPPHGGSGLKSDLRWCQIRRKRSPSTRREWIEIGFTLVPNPEEAVSLHTEGVD